MTRYPGPISRPLLEELERTVITAAHPFVVDLSRCRGMYLATVDGDQLFDWAGYYGSRLLGHNHPGLCDPDFERQLLLAAKNKVPNPDFLTRECLAYYQLLYRMAPACMKGPGLEVYAVNSGAEAVENMMKYLIARHRGKLGAGWGSLGCRRFIYFEHGFHGRTLGALNVTHLSHAPVVTRDFAELIPGNLRMPFPEIDRARNSAQNRDEQVRCLEALRRALVEHGPEIVGILVEPIQGAGGHRLASPEFFRSLSALAHEFDVALAFDEVQTAGGQCGSMFALDLFELPYPPDAVAVAKKFGNGAVFMRESLGDQGVLDSTWGGSLTDMVRVVEEFRIVEREQLLGSVSVKAERLVSGLEGLARRYPRQLTNVRGLGLYQGFDLLDQVQRHTLVTLAREREDLLLLAAGERTIRLRPPLDVTVEEIDELVRRLDRLLGALGGEE